MNTIADKIIESMPRTKKGLFFCSALFLFTFRCFGNQVDSLIILEGDAGTAMKASIFPNNNFIAAYMIVDQNFNKDNIELITGLNEYFNYYKLPVKFIKQKNPKEGNSFSMRFYISGLVYAGDLALGNVSMREVVKGHEKVFTKLRDMYQERKTIKLNDHDVAWAEEIERNFEVGANNLKDMENGAKNAQGMINDIQNLIKQYENYQNEVINRVEHSNFELLDDFKTNDLAINKYLEDYQNRFKNFDPPKTKIQVQDILIAQIEYVSDETFPYLQKLLSKAQKSKEVWLDRAKKSEEKEVSDRKEFERILGLRN